MIYREFLVMRKALLWFVGCTTASMLVFVAVQLSQYRGHLYTDLNELHVPVAWVVTVFAAIFGVALGNASRGPARVLWVLPAKRWTLALHHCGLRGRVRGSDALLPHHGSVRAGQHPRIDRLGGCRAESSLHLCGVRVECRRRYAGAPGCVLRHCKPSAAIVLAHVCGGGRHVWRGAPRANCRESVRGLRNLFLDSTCALGGDTHRIGARPAFAVPLLDGKHLGSPGVGNDCGANVRDRRVPLATSRSAQRLTRDATS
jgi:hypothetical protein